MKRYKNELDVDFIGGSGPLTKEEENAISEFLKTSAERLQKPASQQKNRSAASKRGAGKRNTAATRKQKA